MKQKKPRRPRRWSAYERKKAAIAQRVALSGKEGTEASKLYEAELKKLCRKMKI